MYSVTYLVLELWEWVYLHRLQRFESGILTCVLAGAPFPDELTITYSDLDVEGWTRSCIPVIKENFA